MRKLTGSEAWAKTGSASFSMLMFAAALSSREASSLRFRPSADMARTLARLIRLSGRGPSRRASSPISLLSPGPRGPGSCQFRMWVPFGSRVISGSCPLSTDMPAIPGESWLVMLMSLTSESPRLVTFRRYWAWRVGGLVWREPSREIWITPLFLKVVLFIMG